MEIKNYLLICCCKRLNVIINLNMKMLKLYTC